MIKLSVVVMTLNEAENIGRCLDSIQSIADEIVVVDSGSTDATVDIAKSKGAKIIEHVFEGMIEQRQYCITQCNHNHILALDADEWLSNELIVEIENLKINWKANTYSLNRLNSFNGQWIKHGAWYPSFRLRLFEKDAVINTGTNPHEIIAPKTGKTTQKLKGHLFHISDIDIEDRYNTINKYTTQAAKSLLAQGKRPSWWRIIFKPPFRFFTEYVLQLGFLDGFNGFLIAKSSAEYVFLRESKLKALSKRQKPNK